MKTFYYNSNGIETSNSNGSTYKLEHFFTTRQWVLWHRIIVKNEFYKKNKKGKWNSQKAYKMFANFSGQIADGRNDKCGTLYTITPPGETKYNKSSHTYNYGVRDFFSWFEWFSVAKESLGSEFGIQMYQSSSTISKTNVLKLHNQTCP